MKRNHRDCINIKFYVIDVDNKKRINKKTGHVWNKSEQLPICQQGDELVVCRRICKQYKQFKKQVCIRCSNPVELVDNHHCKKCQVDMSESKSNG